MRLEIKQLQDYQQHSKRILDALASNDGSNSKNILDQLRNGEIVEEVSRRLERASLFEGSGQPLPDDVQDVNSTVPFSGHHSPFVFDDWHGASSQSVQFDAVISHGQETILGPGTDSQILQLDHESNTNIESWTTVTSDQALVEHLLALYFCWEYPIFATVSQEHFMQDFRQGRPRYCSSLLVNALLALACRFSNRPNTQQNDPGRAGGAGDAFFAEAIDILNAQRDRHILTTVQALGVLSIREASCGRTNESLFLSGQSIRLAVEMGLHVDTDDEHQAVREATFWGAFSLNEYVLPSE
jgi:hypothetical protein